MKDKGRSKLEFKSDKAVRTDSEGASMYRIAFEEGRTALSDQASELEAIRVKAVAYMAFIGTAAAFIVSATIVKSTKSSDFYWWAFLSTAALAIALISLITVIWPGRKFTFRIYPVPIVDRYIEGENIPLNEAELLRTLSKFYNRYLEENDVNLAKIGIAYFVMIISGGLSLLGWIITMCAFGILGA